MVVFEGSAQHSAAHRPAADRTLGPGAAPGASGSQPDSFRQFALPSISLPKGGGAVRGIGESFTANAASGTGAMSVPITTSPGRSGFGPALALSYDSGQGNGPFGFGWSLSLPAVTCRTDRGLPRYAGDDIYQIAGSEDLVPVRGAPPGPAGWRVQRFRPRVEGLFARIERWTRDSDGDVHWRSTTRDNVTSWFGEGANTRIADPADPGRIFSWLISRTRDDRGNALVYEYAVGDGTGVDTGQAHERHRTAADRGAQRYPKRIRYGNRASHLTDPALTDPGWMFEVVFDYGDHHPDTPAPAPDRPWSVRSDPFSTYRSGFEVRTYRLCQRVLMFHHFPDEPGVGTDCLVRSTSFTYHPGDAVGQFLTSVVHSGHRRTQSGYLTRSVPPLELEYSPAQLHDEVREVEADSLAGAPAGLAGTGYQWADLDGEGVSGLLAEQAGTMFYKRNLGEGRFGPPQPVTPLPSLVGTPARTRLVDLAGDGLLDLAVLDPPTPGFFERMPRGEGWAPFASFASMPTIDWNDPNVHLVDLDGDGHADVLVTEAEAITWYPSLAETGFAPARRVSVPTDEERGPRLVFADGGGAIHLADMSGDGLTDLVRIRNGEVCYWPNLGYGRFGAKVVMDGAPRFDRDELFDPRYLRLADVDGSGVTDMVYLGSDGARIYLNRGGNGWTSPTLVTTAPRTDNRISVEALDLLGTGTACLVWSSDSPADAGRAMRYIDLLGSAKPHLLVGIANNLGAQTRIRYAPSTRFYLADREAGRPWLTRLPFPVQVVERVTTLDRISRNRFVTRYGYHHGHFDGEDREFRGFGMVEQWDTEELSALAADVDFAAANEDPASHVPPVLTRTWFHTGVYAGEGAGLSRHFEDEYWQEPGLTAQERHALLLDDTIPPTTARLPDGTAVAHQPSAGEVREACRALKGRALRQEVYALDGSDRADRPYQVTESNYALELVQPLEPGDRHAVCFAYPRETVAYHYERTLYDIGTTTGHTLRADPRVSHQAVLDIDGYGNVLRQVAIGYGRRHPDAGADPLLPTWARDEIRTGQTRLVATLSVSTCTNAVDSVGHYRTPQPWQAQTFELLHLDPPAAPGRLTYPQLRAAADAVADGDRDLPFEDVDGAGAVDAGPWRRLIDHVRTRYRRDDLAGPLAWGALEPLGLPQASYQLALTSGLLARACRRTVDGVDEDLLPDPGAVLEAEGGYTADAQGWWIPSGELFYSPDAGDGAAQELAYAGAHFFLPMRLRDAFGATGTVAYDPYDLLVVDVADALGNRVTSGVRAADGTITARGNDYRTLQPRQACDANRNLSAVVLDALGMVVASAVMGKPGEAFGDTLDGVDPDPDPSALVAAIADPYAGAAALIGGASTRTVYDLHGYHRTRDQAVPVPAAVLAVGREVHTADLAGGEVSPLQRVVEYSDGFGRVVQRKAQAEPGVVTGDNDPSGARWVGTGWVVFNNKGAPVRQYEPFFTRTPAFQFAPETGVSPVICYDPVGRSVATLHPAGTFDKVVFDPWSQARWDVNDTVLADPHADADVAGLLRAHLAAQPSGWQTWHAARIGGGLGVAEQAAAQAAAAHAATPSVSYVDSLGRAIVVATHNRVGSDDSMHPTVVLLDIGGNRRRVIDARSQTVALAEYDLRGRPLREATADGGLRITLPDIGGRALRRWDGRGHTVRTVFDPLRRPVRRYVRPPGGTERLVDRGVYGEAHPQAEAGNLRTRLHARYDPAGVEASELFDPKGNLLTCTRRLAVAHEGADWSAADALTDAQLLATAWDGVLDPQVWTTRREYDALDRTVGVLAPDGSRLRPRFNEAGLLESLDAMPTGDGAWTPYVTGVDYSAHGRRAEIRYGNGTAGTYAYDQRTFLLRELVTRAGSNGAAVQHLRYCYDPVGNVTSLDDQAQQTVFFAGAMVQASSGYRYDALYQLISAEGREHIGQSATQPPGWSDEGRVLPHPNDGAALRRYADTFTYDEVGNLTSLVHAAAGGGWTRGYEYQQPNPLDPARMGNRLTGTRSGASPGPGPVEPYSYDAHGNMTAMPHLAGLVWDHDDQLVEVDRGGGGTVVHVFDGDGERIRKTAVRLNGTRQYEWLYLGVVEIFREYDGSGGNVVCQRHTVHVRDDDRLVALVDTRTAGTDDGPARVHRYQVPNILDSVAIELDEHGQVVTYEEYYAFGGTALHLVHGLGLPPKRYRYTGKERDAETGFTYHGGRFYAPWLGRWTAADPSGVAGGANLYVYVDNRPTVARDPDGRLAFLAILAAAAIGALIGAAIGGGIEIGRQLITQGKVTDWGRVGAAAVGGAVAGALAGATGGLSLGWQAAAAVGGAIIGGIITRSINGERTTAWDVVRDGIIGGLTFGLFRGGGWAIGRFRGGGGPGTSAAAGEGASGAGSSGAGRGGGGSSAPGRGAAGASESASGRGATGAGEPGPGGGSGRPGSGPPENTGGSGAQPRSVAERVRAGEIPPAPPQGPVPPQFNNAAEFGRALGWGSGQTAAQGRAAARAVTREQLEQAGATREGLTRWREFYRYFEQHEPRNPTAPGRAAFLDELLKRFYPGPSNAPAAAGAGAGAASGSGRSDDRSGQGESRAPDITIRRSITVDGAPAGPGPQRDLLRVGPLQRADPATGNWTIFRF